MTNSDVFTINNKTYRYGAPEADGYRPLIPCGPRGGKVDRCPVCGDHAHSHIGLHCGL